MSEIFWRTITTYNRTTWVAQILICLIGILLTILIYKRPTKFTGIMLKTFLVFSFLWISVVFFITNGSDELNKYLTATFFAIISLLFLIDIFKNKIIFEHNKKYDKVVLLIYILFISYPFVSVLIGNQFPTMTTWLMPCPLTVYTIALLISFSPKIDFKIFLLLIIWALTGLPKVFMFNVPEDFMLFISGVLAVAIWISIYVGNKAKNK